MTDQVVAMHDSLMSAHAAQNVMSMSRPYIICVMCRESRHYMPHKWISRFPLITSYKSHHMLFLNKWNINLYKEILYFKIYTVLWFFCNKFWGVFCAGHLQVKFRTVEYHQNMLFPSQTDNVWSWKQVEIKNRDAGQQKSAKILVGRGCNQLEI